MSMFRRITYIDFSEETREEAMDELNEIATKYHIINWRPIPPQLHNGDSATYATILIECEAREK